MKELVKKEVEKIIKKCYINCSIEEFNNKVNWSHISRFQVLSESFIREFQDEVNWSRISIYQVLSEPFIREFKDEVEWNYISIYQILSEEFIKEFQKKVIWSDISRYQELSSYFIYELSFILEEEVYEKYFLNNKITKQQLEDIREREIIKSRFDILDL